MTEIKKKSTKLLYANKNQNNYPIVAEIQPDKIQLLIEDDLFFDVLLMEIRGQTISYSSYKKRMNEDKETKLIEEIQVLESEENINYELVENKRKELYTIRQIKMKGVKIRSKARWINDEEKVTKYFCNMENRNYISKCMNSLRKENGNLITEQIEILNETMLYYKQLFKKKYY